MVQHSNDLSGTDRSQTKEQDDLKMKRITRCNVVTKDLALKNYETFSGIFVCQMEVRWDLEM